MNFAPSGDTLAAETMGALQALVDDLRALLGGAAVGVWRWEAERETLRLVIDAAAMPGMMPGRVAVGFGFVGQAARRLEPVIVSEEDWEAADRPWIEAGFRSALAVPIMWDDVLLGVLAAAVSASVFPAQRHEQRLMQMAGRHAAALLAGEHWRSAAAEHERILSDEREQSQIVQSAIRALQDSADIQAHVAEIARAIGELGWRQVVVALRDNESGALIESIRVGTEMGEEELAVLDDALERYLKEDFQGILVGGLILVPAGNADSIQWHDGDLLLAPLRVRQRDPIGVLAVGAPVDGLRPTAHRLRALNILASLLAFTAEHARLLAEASRAAEALAEQVDELSMIHRADRELSSNLDVDRVMMLTIDWALRRTGADSGIVALLSENRQGLVPFVTLGYLDPDILRCSEQDPWPLEQSVMGEVARTGKTVILNQIEDKHDAAPFSATQTRSQLSVPLSTRGEILGVVTLASRRSHAFDDHHASFLERLARRAAIALDNARLLRQSEQLADDMAMLYSASRTITSSLEHDEVLLRIAQSMALALECSSAVILGFKPESQQAQVLISYKVATIRDAAEVLPDVDAVLELEEYPALGRAADERRSLVLRLADLDPADRDRIVLARSNIYAAIIVPLIAQEELIGLAVLNEGRHDRQFAPGEVFKAETLATQASVAIRQALLFSEIRELEKIKSEMIRMASHDLRNPLNNLMGYIELVAHSIQKAGMTADQEEYLNHIRHSASLMKTLIDDLLTLERIESQREDDWQLFDLGGLVSEVVETLRGSAALKKQSLSLDHEQGLPLVFGNQIQLRQAISNLVDNAVKYTPEGGAIEVRLGLVGNRFDFSVADNGYGISAERQERIFERFYRAREPATDHIPGTGLGLSLVKAVVERHGGEVWFKSRLGEGSTFGFWLPVPSGQARV